MAKERRSETPDQRNGETRASNETDTKRREKKKEIDELEHESGSDDISQRSRDRRRSRSRSRSKKRSRSSKYSDESSDSDGSYSDSESESSDSSFSESEDERRRRKRKERQKREERHRERKRRKEKEKRKERDEKKKKKRKKDKKNDKSKKGMGAVTDSWGKYGIIKELDMWNKRPEFTAWLLEIKQVNLESLSNWEEKKMFKEYMEDYNTATFRSKKYYNLDAYHQKKIEKEIKKGGYQVIPETEMTVFNDEEQLRRERLKEREIYKEQQVEALKYSMQGGMAQAMKEQAQLREEMAYQYKLGNFEAAAAIQRRLEPDPPM